ncbi:MAG TPA: serine/threonine-protein kinase [Polyangia bacterium]|jgi:serine/threonine protein kinase|nr:serine/threonine-protein kinase [Polyangia bacterium]
MSTGAGAPPHPPQPENALAPLARGATIGRYVVLGMVGRGGMGEVYAAYDPELDRKVAVKLLRVKPGNGVSLNEGRQRTLREAQAIARLSHANVVVVYDVGTFRDQVFIAMEFVEGNTVTYWLQAQPRSWQEVLRVFRAAGRGLQAAHEKGLVHRDFKPDNVMVSRDGEVRVMDFGLARQVTEKPAVERTTPTRRVPVLITEQGPVPIGDPMETILLNGPSGPRTVPATPPVGTEPQAPGMFEVQLTRTGAMMGTPAYMAPEQFLGTLTDARTDQFSFCVALYEALYGERPFSGNTMFALTTAVVQGQVKEAPASSKVPLWLRKVLLRGLRAQAEDRFASMQDLLEALGKNPNAARRRFLTAAAVALVPVALTVGVHQSLANHKSICGAGPARLAGVWDLTAVGEPEPARQAGIHSAFLHTGKSYANEVYATVNRILTGYSQSWAKMYREACEATSERGEQSPEVLDLRMTCLQERLGGLRALTDLFSEANGEVVENAVGAANNLGSLDRCADVPLLRSVLRPPEDPETRARVAEIRHQLAGEKALFDAGRYHDGLKSAPRLVEQARTLGYQPLVAETLMLAGRTYQELNESRQAEQALIDSYLAADASRHDEVRAEDAIALVWVFGYEEGRYADAQRWARNADAILRRLGGHELLQAWLLNNQGGLYELRGEREEALRAHQQALALKEQALGPDHPDVGFSEGNLSVVLTGLGRNQEALEHVDRSIQILENGLGAGHPDMATELNNRGEILNALGRSRDARASFEKARIIWERELGLENRDLAYALTGIGLSYLAEGDPGNAVVPLERAFKIREAQETDPSRRAETRFALARALWESGRDRGRARALALEARESYAKAEVKTKLAEVETWLQGHSPS